MDTLISAYMKNGEAEMEAGAQTVSDSMVRAFNLLSNGKSYVSEEDFVAFVRLFGESPRQKNMP